MATTVLDKQFHAVVEKCPEFIKTRGLVKGRGDGRHKLPIAAALLTSLGEQPGDQVRVVLEERLGRAPIT